MVSVDPFVVEAQGQDADRSSSDGSESSHRCVCIYASSPPTFDIQSETTRPKKRVMETWPTLSVPDLTLALADNLTSGQSGLFIVNVGAAQPSFNGPPLPRHPLYSLPKVGSAATVGEPSAMRIVLAKPAPDGRGQCIGRSCGEKDTHCTQAPLRPLASSWRRTGRTANGLDALERLDNLRLGGALGL